MRTKVAFYTSGCRLNQAETAVLSRSFEIEGFDLVDFPEPADLFVINTCTVTESGDADTRKVVNKIGRINPNSKIALIGCLSQIQKEKLLKMPRVQWVVGNELKMDLATIFRKTINSGQQHLLTPAISGKSFTMPVAGIDPKRTRANIKIQDGCNCFCSYCEIPYARGRARSREFDDILSKAQQLVRAGHKELVVTGINVGSYQYQDKTITDVINSLDLIKDLKRIRISSIEPTTIPVELLSKFSKNSKLCRFFHIPLQSGNQKILTAMKRNYSVPEYLESISKIFTAIPDVCIGTDVIVGFPGETDNSFNDTVTLLANTPFTYFHVFSYSDRRLAKSRHLKNKVPAKKIEARSRQLRELSALKKITYFERFINKTEYVLFEQKKNGYWTGLTDTYIRVNVISDSSIQNRLLPVTLQGINGQTMLGKLA